VAEAVSPASGAVRKTSRYTNDISIARLHLDLLEKTAAANKDLQLSEHMVFHPLLIASGNKEYVLPSRAYPPQADHFTYLFRRSNSSRLNGKSAQVAWSRAPPEAEKTNKLRGVFHPKPSSWSVQR
jgi:hypothetical protein